MERHSSPRFNLFNWNRRLPPPGGRHSHRRPSRSPMRRRRNMLRKVARAFDEEIEYSLHTVFIVLTSFNLSLIFSIIGIYVYIYIYF